MTSQSLQPRSVELRRPWRPCAIAAPAGTPPDIVESLNREINAVLADSAIKGRLNALGAEPMTMSAAQSAAFVADETAKWGKVIRDAGIKVE